jgi:hypothetical protein
MDGWTDWLIAVVAPRVPLAADDQGPMIERGILVLHPQQHPHWRISSIIKSNKSNSGSNSEQQHAEAEEATGRAGCCPSFPSLLPSLQQLSIHDGDVGPKTHTPNPEPEPPPKEGVRVVDLETACDSHPGAKWAPFHFGGDQGFPFVRDVVRSSHKSCRSTRSRICQPPVLTSSRGGAVVLLPNKRRIARRRLLALTPSARNDDGSNATQSIDRSIDALGLSSSADRTLVRSSSRKFRGDGDSDVDDFPSIVLGRSGDVPTGASTTTAAAAPAPAVVAAAAEAAVVNDGGAKHQGNLLHHCFNWAEFLWRWLCPRSQSQQLLLRRRQHQQLLHSQQQQKHRQNAFSGTTTTSSIPPNNSDKPNDLVLVRGQLRSDARAERADSRRGLWIGHGSRSALSFPRHGDPGMSEGWS